MKKISVLLIGLVGIFIILLGAMYIFAPDKLTVNGEDFNISTASIVYDEKEFSLEDLASLTSEKINDYKENGSVEFVFADNVITFTKEQVNQHGIYLVLDGEKQITDGDLSIAINNKGINVFFTETDLYTIAPKINFDELLNDNSGKNYYYFYQESCSHCKALKPTMTDFYLNLPEGTDFYLVDMAADENMTAWYDWETHEAKYGADTPAEMNPDYISDPSKMLSLDDIKITGTPTMIVTEDGKVTEYQIGNENIESILQ